MASEEVREEAKEIVHMGEDRKQRPESMLVEYQKAQDSAEHHTKLGWTMTAILFSGSAAMLGFSMDHIKEPSWLIIVASLLGILISGAMTYINGRYKTIVERKYMRCKELEKPLLMKQHTDYKSPRVTIGQILKYGSYILGVIWYFILLYSVSK